MKTKNIENTKKYKDLLNRFVIEIRREHYLGYVEFNFGLNKDKKDAVLIEKFNQLKKEAGNDEFIYVAIEKLVRPHVATVKEFKEKQLSHYTHLITFVAEKNGNAHGIKQKPLSVYMIDTQKYSNKINKVIAII
jgi:hypothetical protein